MKKLFKYTLLIVCIALFIFLMLPFLEVPSTSSSNKAPTATQPQIFTSNPLATIAKRIAKFFGRQNAPASNSTRTANALANRPGGPTARYANAYDTQAMQPEDAGTFNAQVGAQPTTSADPDETNARQFVGQEEQEWVLIRQRMPEAAHQGMHEINVKDNPYDRYVKQERLARFSPAMAQPRTQEVPDSRLARLFRPIQRFFGMDAPTAAASGSLAANTTLASSNQARSAGRTGNAAATGPSGRLTTNTAKQARNFQQAQDVNTAFARERDSRDISTRTVEHLSDLVDSTKTIQEAAKLVATSLHPNPTTPQEIDAAKKAEEEAARKYAQLSQQKRKESLSQRGADTQPTDSMGDATNNCRTDIGVLEDRADSCQKPPSREDQIAKMAEDNIQQFQEKTKVSLPAGSLVPILGVASSQTKDVIGEQARGENQVATADMYKFMLTQNNCDGTNCFWVANNRSIIEAEIETKGAPLVYTVEAAGLTYAGDPLHKYEQLKEQFVEHQVQEALKENPQADVEQIRQQAAQAAPPYVLYTQADMALLARQLKQEGSSVNVYFADAADARVFADKHGYDVPFFYGTTEHKALSAKTDAWVNRFTQQENPLFSPNWLPMDQPKLPTISQEGANNIKLRERANQLINDLADNTLTQQRIAEEIKRDASQQAVQNMVAPVAEKIQEGLKNELDNFNQTSTLGHTQK